MRPLDGSVRQTSDGDVYTVVSSRRITQTLVNRRAQQQTVFRLNSTVTEGSFPSSLGSRVSVGVDAATYTPSIEVMLPRSAVPTSCVLCRIQFVAYGSPALFDSQVQEHNSSMTVNSFVIGVSVGNPTTGTTFLQDAMNFSAAYVFQPVGGIEE